jgi:enterochelin esterase family protein
VDGVPVVDPRNPNTSQSNNNVWSLVHVPGGEFMDTRDVPRGAVAEVTYQSSVLGRFRRMHVYTPPGYENSSETFPVFYLLHGASDSDDSWSTVGRAGFILDNLIAEGKAKPMIMVMPAGHTSSGSGVRMGQGDDFLREFMADILPAVQKRYRVRADRANRALAGLSMGGAQTLNIAIPHLDQFAYLGVFSSGIFGMNRRGEEGSSGPGWEERNKEALAGSKDGLELLWMATGKEDFLLETSRSSVELLKKHGFNVTYRETDGGHTWIVWREYLREFAPLLFQSGAASVGGGR